MQQPVIGISCATYPDEWSPAVYGVRWTYVDAVLRAGGIPLFLPAISDTPAFAALYGMIDGLLLTGGVDVDPARYGAAPHEKLGTVDAARDAAEILLIDWAMRDQLPILGICRGLQVLNVALGGSLYQDIAAELGHGDGHIGSVAARNWSAAAHDLTIDADSRTARALGTLELTTNSLHHQAVREVAAPLKVVGRAPDGIVEALEKPDAGHFVVAVQSHPEALQDGADPRWRGLFHDFIVECRQYREQRQA
jgi:putative glutamine amidotransferase